jgi:Tfp pilus assembly protein PilO
MGRPSPLSWNVRWKTSTDMSATQSKYWPIYGCGGAACAALSVVAWIALVSPTLEQLSVRSARFHELRAQQQKHANLNAELASSRQELKDLQQALANSTLRLEPASEVNHRLAALTTVAGSHGMALDELRPGAAADSPQYKLLPIHMAGTGTYPACARFLHTLHERFPDTGLQSFEITNPSPGGDQLKLTFQVELVWYTKK